MEKFKIAGIGEVLWDLLPTGKMIGGAPANFCYHAKNLGADAAIISATGNDALGAEIENILNEKGIKHILNHPDYPTGTVSVELKNGIPDYIIHQNVAWDFIRLGAEALNWIKSADALCFGSLCQRSVVSAEAINQALDAVTDSTLKVLDVNLRQQYFTQKILEKSFKRANVVKLNDEEIEIIGAMFGLSGPQNLKCRALMNLFQIDVVALTMGEKGSLLLTTNEESFVSVPKVKVIDTVGAGDSFTAVMVMGLLNKKPLHELHNEATEYAAKVCTFSGAMPSF
jgi:fructokinase